MFCWDAFVTDYPMTLFLDPKMCRRVAVKTSTSREPYACCSSRLSAQVLTGSFLAVEVPAQQHAAPQIEYGVAKRVRMEATGVLTPVPASDPNSGTRHVLHLERSSSAGVWCHVVVNRGGPRGQMPKVRRFPPLSWRKPLKSRLLLISPCLACQPLLQLHAKGLRK